MIKNASERMWGDMGPFLQAALDAIDKEVSEIIIDGCFNEIYGREAELDLKTRELCTITMLAALGRSDDLETHLAAAFNLGWDLREIVEILLLCVIAVGWPAVMGALRKVGSYCDARHIARDLDNGLRDNYHSTDWYAIGYEKGARLFGETAWRNHLSEMSSLNPGLLEFNVKNLYGKLFTRTILNDRIKILCMISALAAAKSEKSLHLYIIGALKNGISAVEIKEVLFHVSIYAGQEAMMKAIGVMERIQS